MMRSYALIFSAITLRAWRMILEPIVPEQLTLYMIDSWMGFVPNLFFAEWLIRKQKKNKLAVKIKQDNK